MNTENITNQENNDISAEYIKNMQIEGMYAAMNNESPEFPDCVYYMTAYKATQDQ